MALAARCLMGTASQVRAASVWRRRSGWPEIGGLASSLTDLPMLLGSADIVICSTAAPNHIIDKKMMARVLRGGAIDRSCLSTWLCRAMSTPKATELDNVFVYDVDDLQAVLDDNRESRAREAKAAEELIEHEGGPLSDGTSRNRSCLSSKRFDSLRSRDRASESGEPWRMSFALTRRRFRPFVPWDKRSSTSFCIPCLRI